VTVYALAAGEKIPKPEIHPMYHLAPGGGGGNNEGVEPLPEQAVWFWKLACCLLPLAVACLGAHALAGRGGTYLLGRLWHALSTLSLAGAGMVALAGLVVCAIA